MYHKNTYTLFFYAAAYNKKVNHKFIFKEGKVYMNRFEQLLKDFDENQLKEINQFLNSADGMRLKQQISNADKDKLIRDFSKLDKDEVKKRLAALKTADIKKIMKNL